jgi:hypothetical protein
MEHLVRRIVDTRVAGEIDFGRAAYHEDGVAVAWHVTDDPESALQLLRSGRSLVEGSYVRQELGPGFYVSGIPDVWAGRSRKKWRFLARLTENERYRLLSFLLAEVTRQRERRYISQTEFGYGARLIQQAAHGDMLNLVELGGQPFNIAFWKEDALRGLGIEPEPPPAMIKVAIRGPIAELNRHPIEEELDALHRVAVGAFVRNSMGTIAQMVVWNPAAISVIGIEDLAGLGLVGGKAHGLDPSAFNQKELHRGIRVEMEHTSDPNVAREIAMDHLVEDPHYYKKLAQIHLDGSELFAKARRR